MFKQALNLETLK